MVASLLFSKQFIFRAHSLELCLFGQRRTTWYKSNFFPNLQASLFLLTKIYIDIVFVLEWKQYYTGFALNVDDTIETASPNNCILYFTISIAFSCFIQHLRWFDTLFHQMYANAYEVSFRALFHVYHELKFRFVKTIYQLQVLKARFIFFIWISAENKPLLAEKQENVHFRTKKNVKTKCKQHESCYRAKPKLAFNHFYLKFKF